MSEISSPADTLIGETLVSRYRIISKLGAGGMGIAYRAWDDHDAIPVVIKMPRRIFLEDSKFAERFRREIRLLQGLSHPHIVPITDTGEHDGLPFVVMRFLPGGSLSNRRLRDDQGKPRPNPPGTLHLWLPAIAEALDHVHAQGVVHRDVKPGNIFFDAFWGAYLGDFGIAKIVEESDAFDKEHTLTATHMGIGTQEYMAPEQFTPKAPIDGRADQYALAVLVYEIVSGSRPFRGETSNLIVEVLTHPPPHLASQQQDLPRSLVDAVHRGLEKHPTRRFSTCREFASVALRDVPLMQDEPGVARLLCPKCSNMLKMPAEAANRVGSCPRCRTPMAAAHDFSALWLVREKADESDTTANIGAHSQPTPLSGTLHTPSSSAVGTVETRIPAKGEGFSSWLAQLLPVRSWLRKAVATKLDPVVFTPRHRDQWQRAIESPAVASLLVTTMAMLAVLILLALPVPPPAVRQLPALTFGWGEYFEDRYPYYEPELPIQQSIDTPQVSDVAVPTDVAVVVDVKVVATGWYLNAAPVPVALTDFGAEIAPARYMLETVGAAGGPAGGFGGRTNTSKIAAANGGGADTEQAVDRALKWLIQHQMPDGGWHFDLTLCPNCAGRCSHSGEGDHARDRCAATALALLPFLGRGYTNRDGPYKPQIERAVAFLAAKSIQGKGKMYGSEGSLYSQGLAGIALSECYGMTQDSRLAGATQLALNYIMDAQDPRGGGWRYEPKQPGDTSATGWQLMALKSGHMAYLQVNPLTIKKTVEFLDSVQEKGGATYGYTDPVSGPTTSAVGLLCRMYLGWKKDHPALQKGVMSLAKAGPSDSLYHNYYATQIMHHFEGDIWISWNAQMKKRLLTSQSTSGHEAGSWYDGWDTDLGSRAAGRIYATAFATLILETYYRHLPLYKNQTADEEFRE